jgi:hypothetical protein
VQQLADRRHLLLGQVFGARIAHPPPTGHFDGSQSPAKRFELLRDIEMRQVLRGYTSQGGTLPASPVAYSYARHKAVLEGALAHRTTCRVYLGWRGGAADADLGTGPGSHQALGRSTNPLCAERGMVFDVTKGFSWGPQLGGME